MSKEYKNYAVPLEAVEILFLPALRRLSRAVPRTVADISQSLSEQTHALGTKEELQDLKSDAFMYQVKATLQAMARLGYVLVVPKTTTSKTRYLLSDSGADILTAQIRRRGSVIPQSARYELQKLFTPLYASAPKDPDKLDSHDTPAQDKHEHSSYTPMTTPLSPGASLRDAHPDLILAQATYAADFAGDLIERIYAVSPTYFEYIVADVFNSLGTFHAEVIGGPNDHGIDVLVHYPKELCFPPIYVQAKHYCGSSKVTLSDIQKFAGAVLLHNGLQGVFVTCGEFAAQVPQQMEALPGGNRIALVDRDRLVSLMIRHRVGVIHAPGECTYRIDEEYFSRGIPQDSHK